MSLGGFNQKLLKENNIDIDLTKPEPVRTIKFKKYLLQNGNYYAGDLNEFGYLHGHGQYLYANGSVYVGNFRRGLRHGQGRFKYVDGSHYDGEWKSNYRHGYGKYANGDIYQGMWFSNKKHGIGNYLSVAAQCVCRGF